MEEDFLHYIWKFQLFNQNNLLTTSGESLEVLKVGLHNQDAGPDFFNGQIRLDGTRWAGNIELHLKSSDWFRHEHQKDQAYDKVILHVVWEADKKVQRQNLEEIPTLELKGRISKSKLEQYQSLTEAQAWVPCQGQIEKVDEQVIAHQLDRMLVERLQLKSSRISQILDLYKNDWEETLYHLLCKYFGFKVNAIPFELLASSLPFKILRKYQSDLFKLEALLLGQAGFLDKELKGNYPSQLQKEYRFLAAKHQLKPLENHLWKFSRMRPSNFPTIRIAQLAKLFYQSQKLFQKVIKSKQLTEIEICFDLSASEYWDSHYRLDVPAAKKRRKSLGKSSTTILMINVICPLLFTYGLKTDNQKVKDRAINFLETLPAEKNQIIRRWNDIGVSAQSAASSQALIQQKNEHCDLKNCLTCMLGTALIKQA